MRKVFSFLRHLGVIRRCSCWSFRCFFLFSREAVAGASLGCQSQDTKKCDSKSCEATAGVEFGRRGRTPAAPLGLSFQTDLLQLPVTIANIFRDTRNELIALNENARGCRFRRAAGPMTNQI